MRKYDQIWNEVFFDGDKPRGTFSLKNINAIIDLIDKYTDGEQQAVINQIPQMIVACPAITFGVLQTLLEDFSEHYDKKIDGQMPYVSSLLKVFEQFCFFKAIDQRNSCQLKKLGDLFWDAFTSSQWWQRETDFSRLRSDTGLHTQRIDALLVRLYFLLCFCYQSSSQDLQDVVKHFGAYVFSKIFPNKVNRAEMIRVYL